MRLDRILAEANRQSVILVDFQPAYHSDNWGYPDAFSNAVNYLDRAGPTNIVAFFNGSEVGIEDTEYEVREHYIEYGLDEEIAMSMQMIEKSYAWLRGWMDQGVDASVIIKAVRWMVTNREYDSREIPDEVMEEIAGDYDVEDLQMDHIYIPDISLKMLKSMSGSLIGGGGRHECLKELQLLMNAFNIKYKMVDDWIYG